MKTKTLSARHRRGRKKLKSIHGQNGIDTIDQVGRISPDIARLVYEFAYGDIVSRPGLDAKARQLATMAALVAMGNARPQLKAHIHGSMNVGWTRKQIIEVIMQLIVYCGFPVALNALTAADEVFRERKAQRK
ncbi:MAG: carboxymuconolactone decarboxylase family protein [bacterium]